MNNSVKILLTVAITLEVLSVSAFASPAINKTEVADVQLTATKTAEEPAEKIVPKMTSEELTAVAQKEIGYVKAIRPTIGFGLEARFYAPHMDAKVSSDSMRYNNGQVSLKDTLGYNNDNAPEYILRWKRMSLDWIHVHGASNKNLDGALTFDNKTYAGNIKSKSNFDYIKLDFKNPLVSLPLVSFNWNYGISAIHWKGKVNGNLAESGIGSSATEEYWAPVPYIGAGTSLSLAPMDTLKLYANISGLPLGGRGHFYDLEAGLRFNPIDTLTFTAGYRRIDVNVRHNNDKGNINLNGPFAGISYTF